MSSIHEPIIALYWRDVQELAQRDYGTELTDAEMSDLEAMFTVNSFARVDDGWWEGVVAHFAQAISTAIGMIISDHRKSRGLKEEGE